MNATATDEAIEIPEDLSTLTVAQLREIAEQAGVLGAKSKSIKKDDLIEKIATYRERVRQTVDSDLSLRPRPGETPEDVIERVTAAAKREPEEIEAEVVEEKDEPLDDETRELESQALVLREEPPASVPALLPTTAEFDAMLAIAGKIAETQMVPVAYRGKPDDVLAAILTGREMGLGPMQSLRDIYVVDGKPSLSANLLLARLRTGGVVILESESTMERAWIRAQRRDTGEIAEVEWTYAEAEKITYRTKGGTKPLVSKDNWTNYRPDMLWARAVGRLARRLGGDLVGAAMPYTSEEVQDWDDREAPADSGERGHGSDRLAGQWIAPKDWKELSQRVTAQLGDDAAAWMEELAGKGFGVPTFAEAARGERARDLWTRMLVVLHGLEDAERPVDGPLTFVVGVRQIIQGIIYKAFDEALALTGPSWALDPEEAKTLPQRDGTPPPEAPGGDLPAESAPASEETAATPEAASAAEAKPDAASEAPAADDVDGIKF